jgi:hypothetical protein
VLAPLVAQAPEQRLRHAGVDRQRGSIASAARSIPSSSRSTWPATSSAAAALSSTTSRRAPGSPRSTSSTIFAFTPADPPASFAVAVRRNPSAVARISWRSVPSGPTR